MVPEIWTYVGDVEDNPDHKDYRGSGKLRFYLGKNTGPTLRVTAWTGTDWDNDSFQLVLSWPAGATGFVLQSAPGLTSPGNWQPVTNPVVTAGDQKTVTLDFPNSAGFFRLAGP